MAFDTIDLAKYFPTDVLQILYQKGVKISNPGGSIWKMGKCSTPPGSIDPKPGALLEQYTEFSDDANKVKSGDELCVIEEQLP